MSGTTGSGTPTSSNGSVGTSSVSDLDRVFVNDASSGGMFEVQSGQLALNQLEDDQLKKAAQMIVDDHTLANAELKQIAQRKGIVVPTVLQPQHQDVLTKLRASEGNQFNAEFRRTQVEAHEKAIAMFEQYANNGSDAELKTFAQKCLPKLRMHLDELRDGSNGVGGVEPIAGSEPR